MSAGRSRWKNWKLKNLLAFRVGGFSCARCEVEPARQLLHLHHIVPVDQGGPNTIDNVILLCRECHRAEHEKAA